MKINKEKELFSKYEVSNVFCESIARSFGGNISMLDANYILWRVLDGEWIGKRSVCTYDFLACWIEHTDRVNVKIWWCGIDANYSEIFRRCQR